MYLGSLRLVFPLKSQWLLTSAGMSSQEKSCFQRPTSNEWLHNGSSILLLRPKMPRAPWIIPTNSPKNPWNTMKEILFFLNLPLLSRPTKDTRLKLAWNSPRTFPAEGSRAPSLARQKVSGWRDQGLSQARAPPANPLVMKGQRNIFLEC